MDPETETPTETELPTPPTPAPAASPSPVQLTDEARNLMIETVREANRRAEQAQAELERLRNERANPPAPPIDPEQENQEFLTNPSAVLARLRKEITQTITTELKNQIQPLNEFRQRSEREVAYDNLKTQMRADSRFPHLAKIESVLDQIMANATEITPQSIVNGYTYALGQFVSQGGSLVDNTPTPTPAPTPAPTNTPPQAHMMPPSAPPSPPSANGAPRAPASTKTRPLTENERRMAAYFNMTPEEYLLELDKPSNGVVTVKV